MDPNFSDIDDEGYPLPSAKMVCEILKENDTLMDSITLAKKIARWAADVQLERVKALIRDQKWFADNGISRLAQLDNSLRPNVIKKALGIMESVDPEDRITLDPRQHIIITNALKSCLPKG